MSDKFNPAKVKTELLCHGARIELLSDKGRKTGAGPAGGRYFLLDDGTCVDIPLQGKFVEKSPFSLLVKDDGWIMQRNGEEYANVKLIPNPRFYKKQTSDEIPMQKLAVLHGKDCLASTVYSKCVYWREGTQCKFCGIELEKPGRLEIKKPEQLGEVAEEALNERVVKHVTLTVGTPPTTDKGAVMLAEATKAIKNRAALSVHVQLEPPKDRVFLDLLHTAGVDTVGIHIESFDESVLSKICPMKNNLSGYLEAWKYCVELFGDGQVSSFMIAGLGEIDKNILDGAEQLARLGVVPYLLPLRPIVGTSLENVCPPSPERMLKLFYDVSEILRRYGVNPLKNKAGCVRCGACSALNEVFRYGFK